MDPRYAARTATGKYRTTPLRGLWQHAPYFHDGSAPDLLAVVNHYNRLFALKLTAAQKADLVEFLKSLSAGLVDTNRVKSHAGRPRARR